MISPPINQPINSLADFKNAAFKVLNNNLTILTAVNAVCTVLIRHFGQASNRIEASHWLSIGHISGPLVGIAFKAIKPQLDARLHQQSPTERIVLAGVAVAGLAGVLTS